MTTSKRPRRRKLADRQLHPGSAPTPEQIRCDYAVAPLDRLAREMDAKWGVDRLPDLVSVETAEKYGSAMAKLNAAIEAADPEQVKHRAAVCMRGLQAMDAEASAAGRSPASGDIWECEIDGWKFGVLRDHAEWQAAQSQRPDLQIFTLREIGVALKALRMDGAILKAAKEIGGAEIVSIRDRVKMPKDFWKQGGDEVPF